MTTPTEYTYIDACDYEGMPFALPIDNPDLPVTAEPEQDPDEQWEQLGCECELDWNCHLHQGRYTALELQNDRWAERDDEGGW